MSLRGRYVIDRCKRVLTKAALTLPCPPYSSPDYWEAAYRQLGPNDSYEWGTIEFDDLWPRYTYKKLSNISHQTAAHKLTDYRPFIVDLGGRNGNDNGNNNQIQSQNNNINNRDGADHNTEPVLVSDLASVMNISVKRKPDDGGNNEDTNRRNIANLKQRQQQRQQAILVLGCGNSRLGEDMILKGNWGDGDDNNTVVIQSDVSHRVIETMSLRCAPLIEQGHMNFIQDDATEMTAFRDRMIDACFDKGLIDAIYCAEEYETVRQIISQVHRVLKPGSVFCFLSFSRPEFILPALFDASTVSIRQRRGGGKRRRRRNDVLSPSPSIPWKALEVQQLSSILLYKLVKNDEDAIIDKTSQEYTGNHNSNKRGGGGGGGPSFGHASTKTGAQAARQNATRVGPVRLRRRDGKH